MSANRDLLVRVARKVRPLLDELVFVGGAVVELYFTDPASPRVRPTDDTDAICEVTGYTGYGRVADRLRELGFVQSASAADPPYRWRSGPDVLDLMPTDPEILGFSNRWYRTAIRTVIQLELEDGDVIPVPAPAVFVAIKLAAHEGRGTDDPLTSQDLEDVVALFANRPEITGEISDAEPSLRAWIADRLRRFLPPGERREIVASYLPEARLAPELLGLVLERIERVG